MLAPDARGIRTARQVRTLPPVARLQLSGMLLPAAKLQPGASMLKRGKGCMPCVLPGVLLRTHSWLRLLHLRRAVMRPSRTAQGISPLRRQRAGLAVVVRCLRVLRAAAGLALRLPNALLVRGRRGRAVYMQDRQLPSDPNQQTPCGGRKGPRNDRSNC